MAKDIDAVACKIINLAKATALADNHFLAAAIGRLKLEPGAFARPLAADGKILGIDPQLLCRIQHALKKITSKIAGPLTTEKMGLRTLSRASPQSIRS